jgi:acetyl/propionyl-CoA carboxylase alpha subunit
MRRALGEYHVSGIKTNLRFLDAILNFPDFVDGSLDTGLIERWQREADIGQPSAAPSASAHMRAAVIAAALFHGQHSGSATGSPAECARESPWKRAARALALRGGVAAGGGARQ